MDSGFGANGAPYEYAVAEAKSRTLLLKKIALIAAYVLWVALFGLIGFSTIWTAPMLAFAPLSVIVLIFLTWKYTQVEYEYSFFQGTLTVSRILGSRTRKKLLEIPLRDLSAVFPYEDENVPRADRFSAERTVFAASSASAPDLYIALFTDAATGKRTMLCFEANEKAIKIIRYYNRAALSK